MVFRELIQRNFWLKLFSFALATLIWVAIKFGIVRGDRSFAETSVVNPVSRGVDIPVYVLTLPGDARVFKIMPNMVNVTLMGEAALLRELPQKDLRAYVDMTEIRRNENSTEKVRLHIPGGLTVTHIAPLAVAVEQVSP